MSAGTMEGQSAGLPTFAAVYKGSEKREQEELLRKARVRAVGELQQRRASLDVHREHIRLTADADALYLATLYHELLLTHKLPEELARAVVLREARIVVGMSSPISAVMGAGDEEDEGTYSPLPGPVGNEHG